MTLLKGKEDRINKNRKKYVILLLCIFNIINYLISFHLQYNNAYNAVIYQKWNLFILKAN